MGKRVLIIDDSTELVALLTAKLTKAGFAVRAALDGMYGMREALSFVPDVIVLDLTFPGGGGLPILERLKTNLRTKLIPVLVLTAVEDEDVEMQAFKLGAAAYALKPIKPDDLVKEVNRLLSSADGADKSSS